MYKVEYYFDDMLDKVYEFDTEEEALEFYHANDRHARRSYYSRYEYVGKEEEEWNILEKS